MTTSFFSRVRPDFPTLLLSQQRAERIVRGMVKRGVWPDRLLPVGYDESEARHVADDPEALRRQDRRVMVFRLSE